MIWVSWPATFTGRRDKATGKFLAVIWENLADPIIAGRGEIGHPKLYAEIQEPRRWGGAQLGEAGWMGFRFLDIAVSDLRDAPEGHQQVRQTTPSDGTLMLKYVPRTQAWGEADVCQVTLTPAGDPDNVVERRRPATQLCASIVPPGRIFRRCFMSSTRSPSYLSSKRGAER
jgi:hypothetical protein